MPGIKSIWGNSFYTDYTPVPKWSFEVVFDSYASNAIENADKAILGKAIVSVQFGRKELNTVSTFYAGLEIKHPGRINNTGELSIVFNENSDFRISRLLETLFSAESFSNDYIDGGQYAGGTKSTSHTIIVKIIKPENDMTTMPNDSTKVARQYTFYNCFMIGLNEEEISYESDEEIITRTAKFSYDYMKEGDG